MEEKIEATPPEEVSTPYADHGEIPLYLIFIFIFIGIWAAFSWVPFFGY